METIFDKKWISKVLYGGDYNPEQWDEETIANDMVMLKDAGVDVVTINVFSWALIQKDEKTYDFTILDKIVDLAIKNNMNICMGTSTAAHPAWMAQKYPDILRVDFEGRKRKFGIRHNSCPNSPTYKKYSPLLAGKIAERYKDRSGIVAWHVSNEYGGACYCENCEKAFRGWLKDKYGTIDRLNYAWDTAFWGHTFYDFDEIAAPSGISEYTENGKSCFNGMALDYRRFMSDSILSNYTAERDAIKAVIPDAVVTTNFMVMYKELDYRKWAAEMDVVALDAYPQKNTEPAFTALNYDLMRGLKGGRPFMLMEQSASKTVYLPVNPIKRPKVMRLLSYQAMAHGADTVMFFQMRQNPGNCEMYHGAIIDHSGRNDTRVYRECMELGHELENIDNQTLGGVTNASVAILFDYESWWALEDASTGSDYLSYPDEILNYYRAFYEMNISVDIIGYNDPFGSYRVIVAPQMYMVRDGIEDKLKEYVKAGGCFVTGVMSARVDENCRAIRGGFPGGMTDLTGVWCEETDMLYPDESNSFVYEGKVYKAKRVCDVIRCEGATALTKYESDYYKGCPVVTRHGFGKGMVYYVGTVSEPDFYRHLIKNVCMNASVKDTTDSELVPSSANHPSTIEIAARENRTGRLLYIMNHSSGGETIRLTEDCRDIITDKIHRMGEQIPVKPSDVLIMRTVN